MNLKNRNISLLIFLTLTISGLAFFIGCVNQREGNVGAGMSVEQLRESGKRCLIEGKADSAVIYYTLLTETCKDKNDTKSIQAYASACNCFIPVGSGVHVVSIGDAKIKVMVR